MAAVLKLRKEGDIRRIQMAQEQVTYEGIMKEIQLAWPDMDTFRASYVDDEGDVCTLCLASFSDFLTGSASASQLLLKVDVTSPWQAQRKIPAEKQPPLPGPVEGLAKAVEKLVADHVQDVQCHVQDLHQQARCRRNELLQKVFAWKGKGKGKSDSCETKWLRKPKKMLFLLLQLRSAGLLSAGAWASLAASSLTEILSLEPAELEAFMAKIQRFVSADDLRSFTASLPAASENVLANLNALEAMPFSQRLAWLESFYVAQEGRVNQLLDIFEQSPHGGCGVQVNLEHPDVICDGCEMTPLAGLRFKCLGEDFDLCGECYAHKHEAHGGRKFELRLPPNWCSMAAVKGKGKGKCHSKGKNKGKRNFSCTVADVEVAAARPCANENCSFAATWHATHCCYDCARGKGKHGPKCDQKVLEPANAAVPVKEESVKVKDAPEPEKQDAEVAAAKPCANENCSFAHCCTQEFPNCNDCPECDQKVLEPANAAVPVNEKVEEAVVENNHEEAVVENTNVPEPNVEDVQEPSAVQSSSEQEVSDAEAEWNLVDAQDDKEMPNEVP